jgi:hypothetical protein
LEEESKMGRKKYYSETANLLAEVSGLPFGAPFDIGDLRVLTSASLKIQGIS